MVDISEYLEKKRIKKKKSKIFEKPEIEKPVIIIQYPRD
jgi:hypothetical protein